MDTEVLKYVTNMLCAWNAAYEAKIDLMEFFVHLKDNTLTFAFFDPLSTFVAFCWVDDRQRGCQCDAS